MTKILLWSRKIKAVYAIPVAIGFVFALLVPNEIVWVKVLNFNIYNALEGDI